MEDKDFYYDLLKFQSQMVATRSNFALFFQSMLFGAVASLADKETFIPIWLLMLLGLSISIMTGYLNWVTNTIASRAIEKFASYDNKLNNILDEIDREHKFYYKNPITKIMVYIFPTLTSVVWIGLLISWGYHRFC